MKRAAIGVALIVTGVASGAFYASREQETPRITSARVSRGNIVQTIVATGALEAVTTVQVGSQLSGTVQNLYADFNSIVRKGEVLARLDPSSYQSEVDQARADLARAGAEVERLTVTVLDAQTQLERT